MYIRETLTRRTANKTYRSVRLVERITQPHVWTFLITKS